MLKTNLQFVIINVFYFFKVGKKNSIFVVCHTIDFSKQNPLKSIGGAAYKSMPHYGSFFMGFKREKTLEISVQHYGGL